MERLSKSRNEMEDRYDAIVIGSGYGGGIAASRLSRMGLKVCVLERGREFPIGSFPKNLKEGGKEFQTTSALGRTGSRDALFDMRVNKDISVMVGCGPGGTSLINGNVMLEPEPRVFEDKKWPAALRAELSTSLASGYDRARAMLRPVSYPGKPDLKKIDAFKQSAEAVGGKFSYPPINVTFEEQAGLNAAGVDQPACTLCGDCCSGCNVGAKNTIAMNYLPDAKNHGASIFTQCQVHHIEQHHIEQGAGEGARWNVIFETTGSDSAEAMQSVSADIVVCSAGTLGSTEILLRSAVEGLPLSSALGQNFSGNGDVLAFGYNNDVPINGIGTGHPPYEEGVEPVGPVIAGLIDLRTDGALEDNIVIQEGALPSLLAPLLPAMLAGASPLFGDDTDSGDSWDETKRSAQSLIKGAYEGAVHNSQTFLVMAHEGSGGKMVLDDDGNIRLDWPDVGDLPVFELIDKHLRAAVAATGGTYIPNPLWSKMLDRNLVSVHPLGGCAMGDDASSGVVDHKCRVFDGGGKIHKGLYVMDGSAMPRSLGVNPSLTISAISERAMSYFADELER